MAEALTEIFRAASKHPNSRVSKLIHQVEEEPTQKNIVLLLIELAEHAEYSTDFSVSLKYYLDLFERCGINNDLVLNEAGLLLVNSSKIYSKRVDFVESLVERQILALSNADELQTQTLEQEQSENPTPAEKPKRGRKRAFEAPSDPYEVELSPKKFKKLTQEKRFALPKAATKAKSLSRNIEMEQHIHPAGWQHATIYDLENEEDVDTKRNYKLFTFHVEHRYNTLVPDINFRLHFKVKDYMDELEEMEEDESCNTDRNWPPLSEAYVQKYLRLENYVLAQDMKTNKIKATYQERQQGTNANKFINIEPANESQNPMNVCNTNVSTHSRNSSELESSTIDASAEHNSSSLVMNSGKEKEENHKSLEIGKNDSGLGQSILDESNCTLETTQTQETLSKDNTCTDHMANDSALGSSVLEQRNAENAESLNITLQNDSALAEADESTKHVDTTEENPSEPKESADKSSETDSQNNVCLHAEVIDDKTGSIENNATKKMSEVLQTHQHGCTLEISQTQENSSAAHIENDSALGLSVLDCSSNDNLNTSSQNDSALETSVESKGNENEAQYTHEANTISENNMISKEGEVLKLAKARDSSKDSALDDDRLQSQNLTESTKNMDMSTENSGALSIDVMAVEDKESTQVQVQVPSGDDEGVFLSDLEEQDYRLLSPIIKTTNILPGVERKDITIVMDDELRQALEMRDGIIKHFGCETFTLPVIEEPRKANLNFNILQLPEKLVRRKILFKLGPDMDLYLKARCFKRSRADPVTRTGRNFQLLKWFSLNNTDMTGVCITPPRSNGNSSPEFCGFTDSEDEATSADFCGFTEEEQLTLKIKPMSRLSRDSGVGVDVTSVTPEKETFEIIFEGDINLAGQNCKTDLLNSETFDTETTEEILEQLPEDIRDALNLELQETSEGNKKVTGDIRSSTPLTAVNSQETRNLETQLPDTCPAQMAHINTESTQDFPSSNFTKESGNNSENRSLAQTQETDAHICAEQSLINSENNSENRSLTQTQEVDAEQSLITSEPLTALECQEKSSEVEPATEADSNTKTLKNVDTDLTCKEASSAVELAEGNFEIDNCAEGSGDDGMNSSDGHDAIMLDLDLQGTKTKIQQWHEHLQPILAKSRERHHFNIYKLGTEIIDTVQRGATPAINSFDALSNSSAASFENIMLAKDKSYVSRYFLSTLLLANQSNIEISIENKSSEKPSAWHDINLKLLSTKRHTVAIEDNIGMLDSKEKTKTQNRKQVTQQVQKTPASNHQVECEDDEDEPLVKLQSAAGTRKASLKRSSEYAGTSHIAEKKPKDSLTITPPQSQHTPFIQPPCASSSANSCGQPSNSHQAQHENHSYVHFNMNAIRTLQPIEKVQNRSDDYDSGIFSVDEMCSS